MSVFGSYANFYDLLYRDKEYLAEVEYVISLFKKYTKNEIHNILDLGCGTGRHAFLLADKGYSITGLDISKQMLEIANQKLSTINDVKGRLEFLNYDVRNFKIEQSFDAAVSLFHVVSYQTTNEDLISTLQSVYDHLNQGGIFIFDFWYGPAVLINKPDRRLKIFENDEFKIFRFAEPVLHLNENIVDVNYTLLIQNKSTKITDEIKEIHIMRYFFKPEMEMILNTIGFKILGCFEYMTDNPPNPGNWNVCIVGEK